MCSLLYVYVYLLTLQRTTNRMEFIRNFIFYRIDYGYLSPICFYPLTSYVYKVENSVPGARGAVRIFSVL